MKRLDETEFAILRKFKENKTSAMIAGGAVMDLYFGMPYNDVDIFYYSEDNPMGYAKFNDIFVPKVFDIGRRDKFFKAKDYYEGNTFKESVIHVNIVTEIAKQNGTRYQLHSVEDTDVINYINRSFDLNCCMIAHDGNTIVKTEEFNKFLSDLTIRLNPRLNYDYINPDRIKKFMARYPDWKLDAALGEFLSQENSGAPKMKKNSKKAGKVGLSFENYQQAVASQYAQTFTIPLSYDEIHEQAVTLTPQQQQVAQAQTAALQQEMAAFQHGQYQWTDTTGHFASLLGGDENNT